MRRLNAICKEGWMMRTLTFLRLAVVTVVALASFPSAVALAQDSPEEIRREIDLFRREISLLEERLNDLERRLDGMTSDEARAPDRDDRTTRQGTDAGTENGAGTTNGDGTRTETDVGLDNGAVSMEHTRIEERENPLGSTLIGFDLNMMLGYQTDFDIFQFGFGGGFTFYFAFGDFPVYEVEEAEEDLGANGIRLFIGGSYSNFDFDMDIGVFSMSIAYFTIKFPALEDNDREDKRSATGWRFGIGFMYYEIVGQSEFTPVPEIGYEIFRFNPLTESMMRTTILAMWAGGPSVTVNLAWFF